MYIRSKLQQNALELLAAYTESHFSGMRVTRGYVISKILLNCEKLLSNEKNVAKAFEISDKKKGLGIPVNLNITSQAYEQLTKAKLKLDMFTGRSLFPAQVIEILLICATDEEVDQMGNEDKEKSNDDFQEALAAFEKLDDVGQRKEIYQLLLQLMRR